ncbi:hypothetical protein Scep_024091 [Stephania cephalantha]|uniref:Uncharacterized protein n=1 Tax=Stephania cephalantha TaxID=152367 RepID=A0AAP0EX10_9MAGN
MMDPFLSLTAHPPTASIACVNNACATFGLLIRTSGFIPTNSRMFLCSLTWELVFFGCLLADLADPSMKTIGVCYAGKVFDDKHQKAFLYLLILHFRYACCAVLSVHFGWLPEMPLELLETPLAYYFAVLILGATGFRHDFHYDSWHRPSSPITSGRRFSLEEWMGKLLSDIDVSRSVPVASFLELEAAARSSFHDVDSVAFDVKPTGNNMVLGQASSNLSLVDGSSSVTPDYGSDACETSEIGTPKQGRYNSSEVGTEDITVDQELTTPIENLVMYGMTNIENGLFMEDSILEQIEGFPRHKFHAKTEIGYSGREKYNGNTSRTRNALHTNSKEHFSGPEHGKLYGHSRKLSNESVGSDISSIRGSEASINGLANSVGETCLDSTGDFEAPSTLSNIGNMDLHLPDNIQVILPMEQRSKLNRVLMTLQQRLATAKTDMEDLFTRLNQEIAVKEYLTTKVKDLEVELETTKQKSKENLQQAILSERERFTQTQWDMEELRRKSMEMESKLKAEQDNKFQTESTKTFVLREKELLLQEFGSTQEKLANLQKLHEELLVKSKAETKILVKEIKSLRNSQSELKQELALSQKHKSEIERVLQEEKERTEKEKNARRRLLHECVILRHRLQECSVNLLSEEIDKLTADSSSLSDSLDLLTTSDDRMGLLLAEAQLLAQDDENPTVTSSGRYNVSGSDLTKLDIEIRKMLSDIFIDNATLRKQVNSAIRFALQTSSKSDKESNEETPSRKTVLNKFLER